MEIQEAKKGRDQIIIDSSEKLYNDFKEIIGDGNIDASNIMSICVNLMQIVDTVPNLRGRDKKNLVLSVFKRYSDEIPLPKMVLDMIPTVIDMVISLDRGEVVVKVVKGLFKCCCE